MTQANKPIISVSNLTCQYKGKANPALSEITFELSEGETVALIGPNGAGKSTLMKCLVGLLEPSAGRVEISGTNVAELRDSFKTIGFTSDEDLFDKKAKVRNLFKFELMAQGLPSENLNALEADPDLKPLWNSKLKSLSTGQRQRVLINLALLSNPPILILDEPANGLDIEALTWLHALVNQRKAAGLLTIISSHNLGELKELASQVVIIKQTLRHQGEFFANAESLESLRNEYLELVGDN